MIVAAAAGLPCEIGYSTLVSLHQKTGRTLFDSNGVFAASGENRIGLFFSTIGQVDGLMMPPARIEREVLPKSDQPLRLRLMSFELGALAQSGVPARPPLECWSERHFR